MADDAGTAQTDANGTGDNAGTDNTTGNGQTADTGAQTTGNADGKATTDAGDNTAPTTVTIEEFNQLKARMVAADRRAAALEKEKADKAKADMTEVERLKADAEEAKAAREQDKAALVDAKVQNAFLANTSSVWADPEDAYLVLRTHFMDGVEVDDKGKVSGMDAAIKAMAKKKPHLVKSEASSEATGSGHNGRRKGEETDADKTSRNSRFPAMNLNKAW